MYDYEQDSMELASEMCSGLKNLSDAGVYDDFIKDIKEHYSGSNAYSEIWKYVTDNVTIRFKQTGIGLISGRLPHAIDRLTILVVNRHTNCTISVNINMAKIIVNNTLYLKLLYGNTDVRELVALHKHMLQLILVHVAYLLLKEMEDKEDDSPSVAADRRVYRVIKKLLR